MTTAELLEKAACAIERKAATEELRYKVRLRGETEEGLRPHKIRAEAFRDAAYTVRVLKGLQEFK